MPDTHNGVIINFKQKLGRLCLYSSNKHILTAVQEQTDDKEKMLKSSG